MSTHADICLSYALRRADRIVTQIYNRHLSPTGLRGTQFTVLRAIGEDGCITARELSARLTMDQTTVSRALKPLLRDGLLEAREGPLDRREKILCVTAHGKSVFKKAEKAWEEAQTELRSSLGKRTSDQLIAVTREIASIGEAAVED